MLAFGAVQSRKYDLGTQVSCAVQQGAGAMVGVRVTDGTDSAANYAVFYDSATSSYPLLLTAIYTGTQGNNIGLALTSGSKPGSWKLVLQIPGSLPRRSGRTWSRPSTPVPDLPGVRPGCASARSATARRRCRSRSRTRR